jgi:hypothetical protein
MKVWKGCLAVERGIGAREYRRTVFERHSDLFEGHQTFFKIIQRLLQDFASPVRSASLSSPLVNCRHS